MKYIRRKCQKEKIRTKNAQVKWTMGANYAQNYQQKNRIRSGDRSDDETQVKQKRGEFTCIRILRLNGNECKWCFVYNIKKIMNLR